MESSVRISKVLSGGREPLLSTEQLAQKLGVLQCWVFDQVERHAMPVYRPPGGRKLLFERHPARGSVNRSDAPLVTAPSV